MHCHTKAPLAILSRTTPGESLSELGPNVVQCRPRHKPLQLVSRHRVLDGDLKCLPGAFSDLDGDSGIRVTPKESGKAVGLNHVARLNAFVIGFVGEPEREDTLFLWDMVV